MSTWNNIRKQSAGTQTRREDEYVNEDIKTLGHNILNHVNEYNALAAVVDQLEEEKCVYYYGALAAPAPTPYYDANIVNATLKTGDYGKMISLNTNICVGIFKLQNTKTRLEREIKQLRVQEQRRLDMWQKEADLKIAQREKEEQQKKEKEEKRALVKFILVLVATIIITIAVTIASIRQGEPWWNGLITGVIAFFLGTFIAAETESQNL